MRNKLSTIAISVVASLSIAHSAMASQNWQDDYKIVRVGVLSDENQQDTIQRYQLFGKYLENQLGTKVELFTAGSYDGIVQAIAANQIEFSFFGSSAYAAAYTETNGGVRPLVTRIEKDGSTGYVGTIVARCDSGIESIDDLEDKVLAFSDPDSTSGYSVPYFNLIENGYTMDFFSNTPFSGAHESGVQGVVMGQYDAAATFERSEEEGVYQLMVEKGMMEPNTICKILESSEISSGPFAARTNLPKEMLDDMQKAFTEMKENDYKAFIEMAGGENTTLDDWIAVDHDRYQWVVDMRDWLRKQRRS